MDLVYTVVVIGLNLNSSYNDYRLLVYRIHGAIVAAVVATTVAATVSPSTFTCNRRYVLFQARMCFMAALSTWKATLRGSRTAASIVRNTKNMLRDTSPCSVQRFSFAVYALLLLDANKLDERPADCHKLQRKTYSEKLMRLY